MLKAYKYRIYPNAHQKQKLAHHFGCVRWVYNWALDTTKTHYETTETQLSRRDLQDSLVALKHMDDYSWLRDVNSQSLLGALLHLHKAYQNFFKKLQSTLNSKKAQQANFWCPQHVKVDQTKRLLHIPKIKGIKIKLHRAFQGKIKTVTLSKTAYETYYASILVENDDNTHLSASYASSYARHRLRAKSFCHYQSRRKAHPNSSKGPKRLAIGQKIRSRKDYKKRSSNYKKQCVKVAKLHAKVANQRYDFIQQYPASLVRENQATSFALEDLHLKGMLKNRKLARAIADSSWGTFIRVLLYKSKWKGKNVLPIGRFVASSKTCHACGYKKEKLPLSIRQWHCDCGLLHDRDINAAKVIQKQAIADALG